jgi:hypothetical protein
MVKGMFKTQRTTSSKCSEKDMDLDILPHIRLEMQHVDEMIRAAPPHVSQIRSM